AARPAWLASPYLVPQVIPRGRHFDVVIVADGGRLPTAAALPSIVRGEQTVVVGDPLEYGGDSAPSLLDDMLRIAPHVEILRDPHPATEGLRGFAQRRALVGEVTAVPSPIAPEQDRLVMVENGRGMVTEGMEYVESTEAELRRVTDLVIEHARTRPERSLAVLTFTEDHARRLMERIMNTVAVIPEQRDYIDPAAQEAFTVLPADPATAAGRAHIIVPAGVGKTPQQRLHHPPRPPSRWSRTSPRSPAAWTRSPHRSRRRRPSRPPPPRLPRRSRRRRPPRRCPTRTWTRRSRPRWPAAPQARRTAPNRPRTTPTARTRPPRPRTTLRRPTRMRRSRTRPPPRHPHRRR